jgi:hypothetical protein
MRQNQKLEPRSDSIGAKKALAARFPFGWTHPADKNIYGAEVGPKRLMRYVKK